MDNRRKGYRLTASDVMAAHARSKIEQAQAQARVEQAPGSNGAACHASEFAPTGAWLEETAETQRM
jgi:hypothetical protein